MSEKTEYRRIKLPNGDTMQIKFDNEGIVYDLFDSKNEHLESYGYDFYHETVIPKNHANITSSDIDKISTSAWSVLLKALEAIELAPLKDVGKAIEDLKQGVYEQCPELTPKEIEDV